ncbi:MAG: FAD synthetase family protein [Treponema sp.]|jgi:FAD synthase|nr:FAD synthetase family protein [Treponema sp.]
MRVLDWQDLITGQPLPRPAAMTIGVFDGVHRGHQALITRIVGRGLEPVVVTFRQNPRLFFDSANYMGDISSLAQKLSLFESLGVAITILIDFSSDFSRLSGRDFIDFLTTYGNMAYLVIGAQFRCGHGLDTDAVLIKRVNEQNGVETELVDMVLDGAETVSSSRIRAAIRAGDFGAAEADMGRAFTLDIESADSSSTAPDNWKRCSVRRLLPPDGTYRVVVAERETEIEITNGTIMLPAFLDAAHVTHIKFLKNI